MHKKNIISIFLLLGTLVQVITLYLSKSTWSDLFFDSDALYLPALFSDLISKHGHISHWFLTPAPYFFPDYLLFSAAYWTGHGAYQQILVFSMLQILLTFLSIQFLLKQTHQSFGLAQSTMIIIILVWLAENAGQPFSALLMSAYHYGIFMTSIFFIALFFKYNNLTQSTKPIHKKCLLFILCLLAFLSTLSDALFVTQLMIPFIITALLINSIKNKWMILIPAMFSLLGYWSYDCIVKHPTRYSAHIGFDKIQTHLTELYSLLKGLMVNHPSYGVIFILYLSLILYFFISLIKQKSSQSYSKNLVWLIIFSVVSSATVLCMQCLITNIHFELRYLISLLCWPVIITILLISHYLRRYAFTINILLATCVFLSLFVQTYTSTANLGIKYKLYDKDLACIDDALSKKGLTSGIAQYWDAKHIQLFSRLDLNLAQYSDNLDEFLWITSTDFYKNNYDFAISIEKAIKPTIKTKKIVSCGNYILHIYGKNKLQVHEFARPGESLLWQACELPTSIGFYTKNCKTKTKPVSQSGYLSFGPYLRMPSGRYQFEITYSSPDKPSEIIGKWDIALPKILLTHGILKGSDGLQTKVNGDFIIDSNINLEKIEIRTFTHQDKPMTLFSIKLTRTA